jgi:hypothetical protein
MGTGEGEDGWPRWFKILAASILFLLGVSSGIFGVLFIFLCYDPNWLCAGSLRDSLIFGGIGFACGGAIMVLLAVAIANSFRFSSD